MRQGIFYGVGTGPGEAELLTLKAFRIIKACDVLILPSLCRENCRAYNIVKQVIPEIDEKELMDFSFPMCMDKDKREAEHKKAAGQIVKCCESGRDVAFLTLGDPSIYSTYTYVAELVSKKGIKTLIINGISSFQAAAAAINTDLVQNDEMLHLIPGSVDPVKALELPGTKIFMKNKTGFDRLIAKLCALEEAGKIRVAAVSHCGMEDEIIFKSARELSSDPGYLTTIIVRDIPCRV